MAEQKIIGGEFKIDAEALQNEIKQCISPRLSLGRTCFYSILNAIKNRVDVVLLPDYMCSSVVEVPLRLEIPIKHYHISSWFHPDVEDIKRIADNCNERFAILLITYFGLVDLNETIAVIRSAYPDAIIIIDDVQNYYGFGKHIDFDYCFTSCRKWFAVPDGADVLRKENMPEEERYIQQAEYTLYKAAGNLLKNHRAMVGDIVSLELIDKGEKKMDEEYRFCCSDLSINLLQRIDTKYIANRRKKNAEHLHNGLEQLGIQHLFNPRRVPLFIPMLVENRDKIRKSMFSENIFLPIHWPVEDYETQGDNELYRTELSLICDQRYDEEDMERIIRGIEKAM